MSLDAIRQVHDAEARAAVMQQDAAVAAKKRMSDAQAEGQRFLDEQISKAEAQNKILLSAAEKEAEQQRVTLEQDAQSAVDALKSGATARLDAAADFILERIVKA